MSFSPRPTLISGFLRSLRAHHNRPALELGEALITYEQLWDYAGRIAACLRERLAPSETVVALLANRSVGAYGGVLGVLASGRGYVPLNPKFPLERTLIMLNASGCQTVVVGRECAGVLESLLPRISTPLTIITADSGWELNGGDTSPHRFISARDLSKVADPCDPIINGD